MEMLWTKKKIDHSFQIENFIDKKKLIINKCYCNILSIKTNDLSKSLVLTKKQWDG